MAGATMIRFKQLGFSPKSWEEWTLEQIRILIESEKKGDVLGMQKTVPAAIILYLYSVY